jgi:hypothetical protein
LQELIAPSIVIFLNSRWEEIGTRDTLDALLHTITTIPPKLLHSEQRLGYDLQSLLRQFSIAQKMSWASGRCTTRIEDQAYSLLGIFDVHMPLLYGEGDRAFRRLQLEIVSESKDTSIFAWQNNEPSDSGLLAYHPAQFKGCGSVVNIHFREEPGPETPAYEIVGLCTKIQMPILDLADPCFLDNLPAKQILTQILSQIQPRRAIKRNKYFLMALDCGVSNYPVILFLFNEDQKRGLLRRNSPLLANLTLTTNMWQRMQVRLLYAELYLTVGLIINASPASVSVDVAIEFKDSGLMLSHCSSFRPGCMPLGDQLKAIRMGLDVAVLELQDIGYVLLHEHTPAPSFEMLLVFVYDKENIRMKYEYSTLPFGTTENDTIDNLLFTLRDLGQTSTRTWNKLPNGKAFVVSARVSEEIRQISCWIE